MPLECIMMYRGQFQNTSLPEDISVEEAMDLFTIKHRMTYDKNTYEKLGLLFLKKRYKPLTHMFVFADKIRQNSVVYISCKMKASLPIEIDRYQKVIISQ